MPPDPSHAKLDQQYEGGNPSLTRRLRIVVACWPEPDAGRLRAILGRTVGEAIIDPVTTGEEFVTRLTGSAAPDLILAWETSPPLDAPVVLDLAQTHGARCPVIIFTRSPAEGAALRMLELGAADYVMADMDWVMGVAIQRVLREHEQRRRRREAEDRLRDHINLLQLQQVVATAANEAVSPEDAVQSVLDITRAYGHFALGHFFHAITNEEALRLQAGGIWSGYKEEKHAAFREVSESGNFLVTGGVARQVIEQGDILWIPDLAADGRFMRASAAARSGLRSAVLAPVSAAMEVLGVIEFFASEKRERNEHLALVIGYVATQLGRVFERDRAERRLESRAREQMVLAELSRKAIDAPNLDDFLAMAVRRVEDVLAGCRCMVLELTPDRGSLQVRAESVASAAEGARRIPATCEGELGYAILHGDLLKLDLSGTLQFRSPGFLQQEFQVAATASIRLRNDVFGALAAGWPRGRECSRAETAFLRGVANVVATAAEQTGMFQQMQLLGSAVTQSQDAIMITDSELDAPGPHILFVNPAFTEYTGYGIEEVVGHSPRILQGEKTDRGLIQRMSARLRQGKMVEGEAINYRKDGTEYWVEIKISPLRDASGRTTHFLGIQRDITESKLAEAQLRESVAMLDAAQRLAQLGSWSMEFRGPDPERATLYWSEEVFRIFGFPPGGIQVTSNNFFRSVHPEDRARVRETFATALAERREYRIDHRIIRPDGAQRIIHQQATVSYDEAGLPVKLLGTVQDVTERKHAEEELRHWKDRYEMLTKASGQVIYDWDYLTGKVTYGGDIERMLGCGGASLGETVEEWSARLHPEDQSHFEREIERSVNARGATEIEYRLRRADNTYITVKDVGYPMLDATGGIIRILGTVKDISAERALETQLRRSQKMEAFGKLAGGVAHDFNNLLTVISGYNEVVLAELPPGDSRREYIEEIARAANRASALTSQLLAFSRQQMLQPRVFNLNDVLGEMSRMLSRLIGEDITMKLRECEALGNVRADVGQIEQVVMNLVVNARDAMVRGGTITISTRNIRLPLEDGPDLAPGEYVALEVSDTGMGMTPETQARIFEPFFTTKAPGQGTGLGLATCYGIVKQSGGEISVRSKLGAGSTFSICLPRVDESPTPCAVTIEPGSLPTGRHTILLVEDELPVRVIMRSVLQRLKYSVVEAANGAEAMRLLMTPGAPPFELLVTDMVMPEMGGKELVHRVRAMLPGMRVVFTSGYPVSTEEELPAGSRFLQKPFSARELAEIVRDVLVS